MTQIRCSKALSYLLHPILMPFYLLLILLNLNVFFSLLIPFSYKLILLAVVTLTTVVFPLFVLFLLYQRRIITSFFLEAREERFYPILTIALFYYVTYYMLKGVQISSIFSYYMLGATLLAICALIINFYHKVSLHMVGMGGVSGFFLGLSCIFGLHFLVLVLISLLLSGMVGSARLIANAHKPAEIYSGFLMGCVIMTLMVVLL